MHVLISQAKPAASAKGKGKPPVPPPATKARSAAGSLAANGFGTAADYNSVKSERSSDAQLVPLQINGLAGGYSEAAHGAAANGVKLEPGAAMNGIKAEDAAAGAGGDAPDGGLVRRTSRTIKPRLMMVRVGVSVSGSSQQSAASAAVLPGHAVCRLATIEDAQRASSGVILRKPSEPLAGTTSLGFGIYR